MAGAHALRGPRGAAAHAVDTLRNGQGEPGALDEFRKRLRGTDALALRAEHGVHTRRDKHTDRLRARRADLRAKRLGALHAALGKFGAVLRNGVFPYEGAGDVSNLLHQARRHDVGAG